MKHLALLVGLLTLGMSASGNRLDDLKARLDTLQHGAAPPAASLDRFSKREQTDSLKLALSQGIGDAVRHLARTDGYLGDPKVRIPMPPALSRLDDTLRGIGLGRYGDALVTSMNRAAEAAAPKAKTLLLNVLKRMTWSDAKDILLGPDDAATRYFRRQTESTLGAAFKPVVAQAMQRVSFTRTYDRFAGQGVKLGLVDARDARLDDYITRKALDGLFLQIAEQERTLRAHPMQAAADLTRRVLSALAGS